MKRGKVALAVIGLAVFGLTGIGAAPAGAMTVTDRRGDSSTDVDIKSVAINPSGKDVVVKITYWKKAAPGGRACFDLRAGRHSSAKDFWVLGCNSPNGNQAFGGKTSKPIKARLVRISATYTFDPAEFGATKSFRWRATVTQEDKIADAAPDRGWDTYNVTTA